MFTKFNDFIKSINENSSELLKYNNDTIKRINEELKLDIPQPENLEHDIQYLSLELPDGSTEIAMVSVPDSDLVKFIDNLHDKNIKVVTSNREEFLKHQKNKFIEIVKQNVSLN